jgi:hypothetical protein
VTAFEELGPEERVAVVESYVAKEPVIPGPRLDTGTRAAIYTMKRALVTDALSDEGWQELRTAWLDHLAGLPEVEADAATNEVHVFAGYLRGLR